MYVHATGQIILFYSTTILSLDTMANFMFMEFLVVWLVLSKPPGIRMCITKTLDIKHKFKKEFDVTLRFFS